MCIFFICLFMIYTIKREQLLKSDINMVWDFVSSPYNLKKITPNYMNFSIQSKGLPNEIYPGMMIRYKITPIFKIKITWVTEITQVVEKKIFIDEQRIGPYQIWRHEHFFKIQDDGVLMKDFVTYKLPFGLIGDCVHSCFIKQKLNSIFDYRFDAMNQIFNAV